jgi:hypothetical protein
MAGMNPDSPLARLHGNYDRPTQWKAIVITILVLLLVGAIVGARMTMAIVPPHVVVAERGTLGSDAQADLDSNLDFERPRDRQQAIDYALDHTARLLSPSPTHAPSLDFSAKKRPGSSPEYAALFVLEFEAAAKQALSTARAWRVRSEVKVFGRRLVAAHEWILVEDPTDGARIFLDPMLYDAWASSNVTWNVKQGGQIAVPGGAK